MTSRTLTAALALLALGGLATGCRHPQSDGASSAGRPGPSSASANLSTLPIADEGPDAGYSRSKFGKGWTSHGHGCDTREIVINRTDPSARPDNKCKSRSGHWTSVYDGAQVNRSTQLDIDHVVPLAEAWRSGAASWTPEQRREFANDLTHPQLLAVSASSNRAKSDQDPGTWRPSERAYWCTYARDYTAIKSHYRLSVDRAEAEALDDMLATCPR